MAQPQTDQRAVPATTKPSQEETGPQSNPTEARGELAGSAATNSQQSTSSGQNEENAANLQNSHGSTQAQAELSGQQVDPREHAGANNKWTQTEAQQAWQAALGDLESMTESFARMVTKVVAVGTQHLRLEFPANGTLAMKRCELPEHRNTLIKAVSKHAGREITLEYSLAASEAQPKKAEATVNKPSRIQRMREIETNDLIRSCMELFNAEIVRIDRNN